MKRTFRHLSYLTSGAILCAGLDAAAATSEYLIVKDLPFVGESTDLGSYLSAIFQLGIGIAVTLAVVMLVINGIQYMFSDIPGVKLSAKNNLGNIIWGLLLAFSSWLILYTINPNLVQFELMKRIEEAGGAAGGGGEQGTDTTKACSTCVPIPPALQPVMQATCGSSCKLAPRMIANLEKLNTALKATTPPISWAITEAFPPSGYTDANPKGIHQSACHGDGTCVDANFRSTTANGANIATFVRLAGSAGLRAVYEVRTPEQRNALIAGGAPAGSVKVIPDKADGTPRITAPHFSIY